MDEAAVKETLLRSGIRHSGVKGMKWGVRKDRGHEGERVKLKKLPKLDKKWAQQFEGISGWAKVNNLAADHLNGPNGRFAKLAARPQYKGKDFKDPKNKALYQKYLDDGTKEVNAAWRQVAKEMGVNPSGTQRLQTVIDPANGMAYYKLADVKHSGMDDPSVVMVAELDANGYLVNMKMMDEGTGEIKHFGIKGMRWGKKKAHPVTSEAKQKQGVKEKVKKTKIGSVSNADLQAAIRRMQLEQDFKRLSVNEKSGVARWVSSTLLEIGKREVQAAAAKKIGTLVAKKVATAGVA